MSDERCEACDGTGAVDTGGFTPWGQPIDAGCPYCTGSGVWEESRQIRMCAQCGDSFESECSLGIICGRCDYQNGLDDGTYEDDRGFEWYPH